MRSGQNGEIQHGRCGLLDWELDHQPNQNVVLLRTTGPIDKQSMAEMLEAMLVYTAERHSHHILADHRASSLNLDPLEIYYLPKALLTSGIDSRYFAGLVFSRMTEDLQFLENVCRNSGFQVAVFTSLDAATEWLAKHTEHTESAVQPPEGITRTKAQH